MEEAEIVVILTDPPIGPGGRATAEPTLRCYGHVSRRTLRALKRAITAKLAELGEPIDEE